MNDVDRCLICGEVIPEGSQVCTTCRNKYDIVTGETEEMAQELRDIADVLKITDVTDTNIRKSMESILRIADRLERKNNGKKRGYTATVFAVSGKSKITYGQQGL